MSKFLMLSGSGEGYGLALRLKQAGHTVKVRAVDKRAQQNYDGLLEKVGNNWADFLDKQTVAIFDSSGGGNTADRLKQRGFAVWCGSSFADQIELDRGLAFELLEQAGVKIPETKTFYDWESGRAYAKAFKGRLVFKASGDLAKDSHIRTYVSYDPGDMIAMLDYYEKTATHSPEFELQEYKKGLVLSTEGWFNGDSFMEPFNHTLEHKAMYNDDLGPSTGCAFDVVWKTDRNYIVEEGVALFEPLLREYGHVGLVDLNTVVNEEGVWALEFTPRMGYDSFATTLELYNGDIGELIYKMAKGEQPDKVPLNDGFGSAIRITVPPHPSEQFKHGGDLPIRGFDRSDREHLYFYDVKLNETNDLVSTSAYGNLVACTGCGVTVTEALQGSEQLVKKAKIPEKQARTDSIPVLNKDFHDWTQLVGARHNVLKEVGGNG